MSRWFTLTLSHPYKERREGLNGGQWKGTALVRLGLSFPHCQRSESAAGPQAAAGDSDRVGRGALRFRQWPRGVRLRFEANDWHHRQPLVLLEVKTAEG